MEKLRNPDSTSTSSNADASSQEDPDVEEEDEEPNEEFPSFNFSEALQRGKDGRIPLTVLLFQGMDAAPKDVLRQVLCFWHAQCLENGAPLLIFLGSMPWKYQSASFFASLCLCLKIGYTPE
jgi:hypothetical protein